MLNVYEMLYNLHFVCRLLSNGPCYAITYLYETDITPGGSSLPFAQSMNRCLLFFAVA